MKKIFLSFIGSNDAGKLNSQYDGAIITALTNEKFDEAVLYWNNNKEGKTNFSEIADYLSKEIKKRKLLKKILLTELNLKDITDHNEIYTILQQQTDKLIKDKNHFYTAAISSGTPAMQVCWILLAESGDFSEIFPLRLVKVKDPRYGPSKNIEVKLETSLPRIIRLKEENENLKKNLIPFVELNCEKGEVLIDGKNIDFSPIEYCYYKYFAERKKEELNSERFDGQIVSLTFVEKIYQYHEESFPHLDLNRKPLKDMLKAGLELSITTFRGNVSKVNKKIREGLDNDSLYDFFSISIEGRRGAKYYGIKAPPEKILIK